MKNKKTIPMLDINYYPLERRVGQIGFTSTEQDIVEALGFPSEREYYYYSPTQYSINMFYPTFALFIGFQDNIFQGTSLHLDDLILGGKRFSDLTREQVLKCIKKYHTDNGIDYLYFHSDESGEEEYYEFDNLGLTIWFDYENITNICVQSPQSWE